MKYKIKSIGLDTRNLNQVIRSSSSFDYLLTEIGGFKEDLIFKSIKDKELKPQIIVHASYQDLLDFGLSEHLKRIGVPKCSLLLDEGVDILEATLDSDQIMDVGILGNELEKIKLTYDKLIELDKKPVSFIATDLCPFLYNKELVDWVSSLNLQLVSLNQMGGYINAHRNIMSFSVPYLLSFAGFHSDCVILSGREESHYLKSEYYLRNSVINLEYSEETEKLFKMKKSVNKEIKPLKQVVYTGMSLDKDFLISYNNQASLLEGTIIEFSLGKPVEDIIDLQGLGDDPLDGELKSYAELKKLPEDSNSAVKLAHLTYSISNYLRLKFPEYSQELLNIGDKVAYVELSREDTKNGFWFWKKSVSYPKISALILFRENEPPIVKLLR